MLTEKNILAALAEILVPGIQRDLASMNLILGTEIKGEKVRVSLASTALDENAQSWVHEKSVNAVKGLDARAEVEVTFIEKRPVELNKIKNVIAIMSGKGGVGKSLVAGLTQGRKVAVCFYQPVGGGASIDLLTVNGAEFLDFTNPKQSWTIP